MYSADSGPFSIDIGASCFCCVPPSSPSIFPIAITSPTCQFLFCLPYSLPILIIFLPPFNDLES